MRGDTQYLACNSRTSGVGLRQNYTFLIVISSPPAGYLAVPHVLNSFETYYVQRCASECVG